MKTLLAIIALGILALSPVSAETTHAAFFGPLIPEFCHCEDQKVEGSSETVDTAPDFGCVMQTVQNGFNLTLSLISIAFVIALVIVGAQLVLSAGNPQKIQGARDRLMSLIIGLVVFLCAWLIVDYVMKVLYKGDTEFGPWNEILAGDAGGNDRCIVATQPTSIISGTLDIITGGPGAGGGGTGGGVTDPITGTAGCPNCVKLEGFACKSANSCTIDPQMLPRLTKLVQTFKGSWAVTEAYPPTVRHSNKCHSQGTCIDAGFRGNTTYNAENIAAFASAASSAGLRVVFETESCSLRDAAQKAGVRAYCKSDNGYGHITGSHFSVYSN